MEENIKYFTNVNNLLKAIYCVDFNDIGLSPEEWLIYFGDLSPLEAVLKYGEKYDLTPLH